MSRCAVLIMAAGRSRRFGLDNKLLAPYRKSSILQHSLDQARAVFNEHVYLVTGCYHQDIQESIQGGTLIYNPDWAQGLGSSIAMGVSKLADRYDGVLIVLGDQVAIESEQLASLQQDFTGRNIVCAYYQHRAGVPAIFPRQCFAYLQMLKGDQGARDLLNGSVSGVEVEIIKRVMPSASIDIDTVGDLATISG